MCKMAIRNTEIKEFFEQKFIEWRTQQKGLKATLAQFAESMDITRDTLNSYMIRGSKPEGDNLDKVGRVYPEVYGLVGRTPPNPLLRDILEEAGGLDEEGQRQLIKFAAHLRAEREKAEAAKVKVANAA